MNNNPHNENLRHLYSQLKHIIDNKVDKCCNDWFDKQCLEAEQACRKNDMRTLFQKVKTLKKGVKSNVKSANIQDKDGCLLTKEGHIRNRWYGYRQSLYNTNIETDLEQLCPNCKRDEHEPDILESEVRAAIDKIKQRKAPGIDGIEDELIKNGGDAMVRIMHKICDKIWATGEFPALWTKSLEINISKKGDTTKCENHCTISLICQASKIIRSWMKGSLEAQMAEEQARTNNSRENRGRIVVKRKETEACRQL